MTLTNRATYARHHLSQLDAMRLTPEVRQRTATSRPVSDFRSQHPLSTVKVLWETSCIASTEVAPPVCMGGAGQLPLDNSSVLKAHDVAAALQPSDDANARAGSSSPSSGMDCPSAVRSASGLHMMDGIHDGRFPMRSTVSQFWQSEMGKRLWSR